MTDSEDDSNSSDFDDDPYGEMYDYSGEYFGVDNYCYICDNMGHPTRLCYL